MEQLNKIGFYKELSYGSENGGSIYNFIGDSESIDKLIILDYLKNGSILAISPGFSRDIISKDQRIIGPLKMLSDGKFLWASDLIYYYENYNLVLPLEFRKFIIGANRTT